MTNNEVTAKEVKFPSLSQIGQAAVAIPLAHLVLSTLNLWSFSVGYGAGVGSFMDSSDLFRASVTSMTILYITMIYMVSQNVISIFFLDKLVKRKNNSERPTHRRITLVKSAFFASCLILIIIPLFQICISWFYKTIFNYTWITLLSVGLVGMTMLSLSVEQKRSIGLNRFLIFAGILVGVVFTVSDGAQTGTTYRHSIYTLDNLRSPPAQCGDAKIIYPLSSNFLAIMPSNNHVIIDSDCKILFTIPSPTFKTVGPLYPFR